MTTKKTGRLPGCETDSY